MIVFTKEQVKAIHKTLINKTGGIDGVRDEKLLDSALQSPFQTFDNKDLYSDITDKAVQLCYSIIENHPFVDGNKRIGIHLMLIFLELNNKIITYTQTELIDLGLGIAAGKILKPQIKDWIEKHKQN